jgi:hypothetical protein
VIVADKPKIYGQQVRKLWTIEVEDLSRVPVEYLLIDGELLMRDFHRARNEGAELVVPGIRFYQREIIASEGTFQRDLREAK